jgi:DNA-binding MarR family transcriptional regulator
MAVHAMDFWLRLDLTMPQFQALRIVWTRGRVSGRQLARELRVTPGAVVAVCDRLQAQGYVERVRDLEDRRIWWFQLTPAGQEVFQALTGLARTRIGPALDSLSDEDRESLARSLNSLVDALERAETPAGVSPPCPGEGSARTPRS